MGKGVLITSWLLVQKYSSQLKENKLILEPIGLTVTGNTDAVYHKFYTQASGFMKF